MAVSREKESLAACLRMKVVIRTIPPTLAVQR